MSIQSLILVPEPYFNEPGYERARGIANILIYLKLLKVVLLRHPCWLSKFKRLQPEHLPSNSAMGNVRSDSESMPLL